MGVCRVQLSGVRPGGTVGRNNKWTGILLTKIVTKIVSEIVPKIVPEIVPKLVQRD